MSHKKIACSCDVSCRYCSLDEADAAAIAAHNLRCACHGERSYPGKRPSYLPPERLAWSR